MNNSATRKRPDRRSGKQSSRASKGIGAGIAKELARKGPRLPAADGAGRPLTKQMQYLCGRTVHEATLATQERRSW